MTDLKLLNIGFGDVINASRVVAILSPDPAPMKQLRKSAQEQGMLVDATHGRKTRSLMLMDTKHLILCSIQPETIAQRLQEGGEEQ